MGALASRRRRPKENKLWQWSGPPGRHSPFPIDIVAYPGTPLLYCFIDIMTKYKIMRTYDSSFLSFHCSTNRKIFSVVKLQRLQRGRATLKKSTRSPPRLAASMQHKVCMRVSLSKTGVISRPNSVRPSVTKSNRIRQGEDSDCNKKHYTLQKILVISFHLSTALPTLPTMQVCTAALGS